MLEQLGVFTKKYMFPLFIITAGIVLIIVGLIPSIIPVQVRNPTTGEIEEGVTIIMQTKDFLMGATAILIAGIITLLYTLEIISKLINTVLLVLLFATTGFFAFKSYKSVKETIAQNDAKEDWDNSTKQALSDVRDVQLAYKKKYGFYASDYKELTRFLKEDKIMDVIVKGEIPDRRVTDEEGKILGYDKLKDEAKYNDIDEAEAVLLNIIEKDTLWYPVMEVLFTGDLAKRTNEDRLYPFEVDALGKIVNVPSVNRLTKGNKSRASKLEAINPPVYPMYTDTIREEEDLISHLYLYDPIPYDPFVKRDTLKVGSKTEPKTNGSWAEK
jgi:Ca2+/Na+ antiporter